MAKRHYFEGVAYLHNPSPELSVAENLLRMTRADKSYTAQEAHLLDLMLILHAEHSSNNSTFVCRAISSSGSDTYSAIAGAVGSLKGPLHGGANAKVLQMFRTIRDTVGTRRRTRRSAPASTICSTARPATAPASSTALATRCTRCPTRARSSSRSTPRSWRVKRDGWPIWS